MGNFPVVAHDIPSVCAADVTKHRARNPRREHKLTCFSSVVNSLKAELNSLFFFLFCFSFIKFFFSAKKPMHEQMDGAHRVWKHSARFNKEKFGENEQMSLKAGT